MEWYERFRSQKKECLVVLERHVPFQKLIVNVPKDIHRCFLLCRDGSYEGPLENACWTLLLGHEPYEWMDVLEKMLPIREEFQDPQLIPVVCQETWKTWKDAHWKDVSILQTSNGWEFYETLWLLQRWEAGLSIFDDDLYLNVPSYPKDLFNILVPPQIVLREVRRFKIQKGEDALKTRFFGLYLLTQLPLGKKLLKYFYEFEKNPVTLEKGWRVFIAIRKLVRSTPVTDPFYPYLLGKNFSTLRIHHVLTHKPYMMINQFLSFYGMYVSNDFWEQYYEGILQGIRQHYLNVLFPSRQHTSLWTDLKHQFKKEMNRVWTMTGQQHMVHWIGKYHVEKYLANSEFWSNIYRSWDVMQRRNLYLWVEPSFHHREFQMEIGWHLSEFFKHAPLSPLQKKIIRQTLTSGKKKDRPYFEIL